MDYSRGRLSQLQELGLCPRQHFILVTFIRRASLSSPKSFKMEGDLPARWFSGLVLMLRLGCLRCWFQRNSDWQDEAEESVSGRELAERAAPQCLTREFQSVARFYDAPKVKLWNKSSVILSRWSVSWWLNYITAFYYMMFLIGWLIVFSPVSNVCSIMITHWCGTRSALQSNNVSQ